MLLHTSELSTKPIMDDSDVSSFEHLLIEELISSSNTSSFHRITHDGPVFATERSSFPTITRKAAEIIDKNVNWQDAISLTFLVLEKASIAHKFITVIESTKRNLFPLNNMQIGIVESLVISAERNKGIAPIWEMKVYQALVLIGLKRLLYDLGVDETEIKKSLSGTRYVKNSRRLLFQLADSLGSKEANQLLALLLEKDVQVSSLEVHFLSLMTDMNTEMICPLLHAAIQKMDRADILSLFLSLGNAPDTCSCSIHKTMTNIPRTFPENEYFKQGRGLAIIVNQKMFSGGGLQHRLGTDRDRDELAVTFTLFDAELMITDNLSAHQMTAYLEVAAQKANNQMYHWLAVCILSHGRRVGNVDEILGCDGVGIDRKSIVSMFACAVRCPNMQRKPKLFVFQACRGKETQPQESLDVNSEIMSDSGAVPIIKGWPGLSDYMIASSTIEDYVAFRSTVDGSFYIRHLCKVLQDRGHDEHLQDIMTLVANRVMGYRQDYPSAPEFTTTLSKKFQLKRTRESTMKCVEMMARNQLFNIELEKFIEKQAETMVQAREIN